jgi:large subunit ribosomal protein L6
MRAIAVERLVEVPDGIDVKIEGRVVTISGAKGTLTKDFSHAPLSIQRQGKSIKVHTAWPRKKEAAIVGSVSSHIQNMITGVTNGFTYKLKIVFSHFPISVKVDNRQVLIENFTGERSARIAKIVGDAKVSVQSDDVLVQGTDLQDVSQTAANVEQATKLKVKDPRVFLDGIYVYERLEGMQA